MLGLRDLYRSLSLRRRPEDVAQIILHVHPGLSKQEETVLNKAASGSLVRSLFGYTSMLESFAHAVGAGKQVAKAQELFKLPVDETADYNDHDAIEGFIQTVSPLLRKPAHGNNFLTDRLNKAQRKASGLELSRRAYNKRWRLLKRLEAKLATFGREARKAEFAQIAKHGLAHRIRYEDFVANPDAASFIAYYTARCNLRSVFTNGRQVRPFDDICGMLFTRCLAADDLQQQSPVWLAVAYVYPDARVLGRLTDDQKGVLLGTWTAVLRDIASLLEEVWSYSSIRKETMVVKRGDDSTTWNNTAGAWNKARDAWINLVYALGLSDVLEEVCFGKVLRLMAADVVAWHRASGKTLDPNTFVWNALPLPWEVFRGEATCGRTHVSQACAAAGLDAEKSGWIAPRPHGVTAFTPTPELVHGVAVADPFLASVLKRHRYFSGKPAQPLSPAEN